MALAEEKEKKVYLKDGCEWPNHEDCIIGSELGLRNLINACEIALEEGEYYGSTLGDYIGVKLVEDDWFSDPQPSEQSGGVAVFVIVAIIGVIFFSGIYTIFSWLFG